MHCTTHITADNDFDLLQACFGRGNLTEGWSTRTKRQCEGERRKKKETEENKRRGCITRSVDEMSKTRLK
jgi:hypothetical protein